MNEKIVYRLDNSKYRMYTNAELIIQLTIFLIRKVGQSSFLK